MENLTKHFLRTDLLKLENKKIKCNTIIIPDILWKTSMSICMGENEVCGWIVCKKQVVGDFVCFLAEYIWMPDEGSAGSVIPTKKMNLPDDYLAIECHVHPAALGEHWANTFSDFGATGDYATFRKRMADDESYKHVLFTPTHILTFGNNTPDVRISTSKGEIKDFAIERFKYWKQLTK